MNIVETLKAQVRPEMNPELSWAIIILFSGIIVWVTVRYINRLDTMIDKITGSIDSVERMLAIHDADIKRNTEDIKSLKEANRLKRR